MEGLDVDPGYMHNIIFLHFVQWNIVMMCHDVVGCMSNMQQQYDIWVRLKLEFQRPLPRLSFFHGEYDDETVDLGILVSLVLAGDSVII